MGQHSEAHSVSGHWFFIHLPVPAETGAEPEKGHLGLVCACRLLVGDRHNGSMPAESLCKGVALAAAVRAHGTSTGTEQHFWIGGSGLYGQLGISPSGRSDALRHATHQRGHPHREVSRHGGDRTRSRYTGIRHNSAGGTISHVWASQGMAIRGADRKECKPARNGCAWGCGRSAAGGSGAGIPSPERSTAEIQSLRKD